MHFPLVPLLRLRTTAVLCIAVLTVMHYIISSMLHNWKHGQDKEIRRPACVHPHLDINDTTMTKFFRKSKPIICDPEPDWVIVHNATCRISIAAKVLHGEITCNFTDIIRKDENTNILGNSSGHQTEYKLLKSDYVLVKCKAEDGTSWSNVVAGVRYDPDILKRVGWEFFSSDGVPLSIFIWSYDSLSRLTFIRKLWKTYSFFVKDLDGVVLEGYNVVGDGTTQNMIPLLTGFQENELPDTRKGMGAKAQSVSVYPFIWKEYKENGYVTAFLEDWLDTIFHYRLKGFDASPSDHCMRSFFVEAEKYNTTYKAHCIKGTKTNQVVVNVVKELFTVYGNKPKFIMTFQSELTHDDCNLVGAVDEDVKEMLQYLKAYGYLNHTLVILLSDHGHRSVRGIRDTMQGKQEERLPIIGLAFPEWFKERYPLPMLNLRQNIHRLTTPFDLHETLKHILHLKRPHYGTSNQRALSLFQQVPLERTCSNASVDPHWCTCLNWIKVPLSDARVQQAAYTFVQTLNEYIEEYRNICETIHFHKIIWAKRYAPKEEMRKFKYSDSRDYLTPRFTANTKVNSEVYELKLYTRVGNFTDVHQHFEVTVDFVLPETFSVSKMEHVSRTDSYSHQADCLPQDPLKDVRKFCYCKETSSDIHN